jgi:hypothetical protein
MNQQYQFTDPPRALRKAKLDNIVLVPASALPFKAQYQKIANSLPKGSVLLCHSVENTGQQKLLETVGAFFQKRGHRVTMFSTEGIFI